jgi:hypothetical protein
MFQGYELEVLKGSQHSLKGNQSNLAEINLLDLPRECAAAG